MSQNTDVLQHLKKGKSITSLEALEQYGIFRLAARCNDLRNLGHDIKTVMIEDKGKKFAKYYIQYPQQSIEFNH